MYVKKEKADCKKIKWLYEINKVDHNGLYMSFMH